MPINSFALTQVSISDWTQFNMNKWYAYQDGTLIPNWSISGSQGDTVMIFDADGNTVPVPYNLLPSFTPDLTETVTRSDGSKITVQALLDIILTPGYTNPAPTATELAPIAIPAITAGASLSHKVAPMVGSKVTAQ